MTNDNSNIKNWNIVEELSDMAWGLPADMVRAPDLPMPVFIDEGKGYIGAARQHMESLVAVGMPPHLVDRYERYILAAEATQTKWNTFRNKGRSESTLTIIEQAIDLRGEALATADLALRNNNDGQWRLSNIRDGEGLADTVADMNDLAVLVRDAAPQFEAIKVDAPAMATQLETLGKSLQEALVREDVAKSLSTDKELRDRFYTLSLEPLRELRAFADFAFRKDKGNNRRFAFTSAYKRRHVRKHRRAAKLLNEIIVTDVDQ